MLRQAKRDNFYPYGYPATDETPPTILPSSPFRKTAFPFLPSKFRHRR
jgi:hypothetical protein